MDASKLNPALVKPGLSTPDGQDLKPSLVTPAYSGGLPGAGDLKPGLVDAAGNLKPSLVSGNQLKPGIRKAGYSPLGLPGFEYWLAADPPGSLYDADTGGDPVAADGEIQRWEDRGPKAYNATNATAGQFPLRRVAARAGEFDTVEFVDSDDQLNLQPISLSGAATFVVRLARDFNTAYHFFVRGAGTQKLGFSSSGDAIAVRWKNGGSLDEAAAGVDTTAWHWYAVRRDADDKIDFAVDGGGWTRLFGDVAQDGSTVFDILGQASAFNGQMADVILCTAALTQAEFASIVNGIP